MATATSGPSNPDTSSAPFSALDAPAPPPAFTAGPVVDSANSPTANRKTHSPQSDAGRSTASVKSANAPLTSRIHLTGAGAMAEIRKRKRQIDQASRETSPNPAAQAMQSLLVTSGMSKPSDAPDPDKLGVPLQKLAQKIQLPETTRVDTAQDSSPTTSSFSMAQSMSAGSALTATAGNTSPTDQPQFVAEPGEMTEADQPENVANGSSATEEGPKAFTYPGPQPQTITPGPSRGMSLPGYGQSSPRSPSTSSSKRHKCPYCETEFTRHHNLKSHLLTHSQEKPYVCGSCPSRFRRLHDLKRHTKLHTGERPHTCDKCGRSFARGDALARHNKGPGGCAGQRSSFGGDDEYGPDGPGGEGMDGLEYTAEDEDGAEAQGADSGRRVSEPSGRKRVRVETQYDTDRSPYRQQSSTYPPVFHPPQPRPHPGGIALPSVVLPDSNQVASPRDMNSYPSPATAGSASNQTYYTQQQQPAGGFQHSGMTDSPKPLSPGHPPEQHRLSVGDASMSSTMNRNRSPSLTTQFQHAHLARPSGGRSPPAQPHQQNHVPVLPPLNSTQSTSRSALSQPPLAAPGPPGSSALHSAQQPPTGPLSASSGPGAASSNPNSMSSHGHRSSGGSIRDVFGTASLGLDVGGSNPNNSGNTEIWSFVRNLEHRFTRMQEEYELRISRLQEEVYALRGQVAGTAGSTAGASGTYSGEIPQPRY